MRKLVIGLCVCLGGCAGNAREFVPATADQDARFVFNVRNATQQHLSVGYCPPNRERCAELGSLAPGAQRQYTMPFDPGLAQYDNRILIEAFEELDHSSRRLVAHVPVFQTPREVVEVVLDNCSRLRHVH